MVPGPGPCCFRRWPRQGLPAVRAEILRVALEQSFAGDSYLATATVLQPYLLELPAVAELGWFADSAGRALYATGRYDVANDWYTVARLQAGRDEQAAQTVAALWPYAMLSGDARAPRAGNLATWQAARGRPAEFDRDETVLLRGTLQALGHMDPLPWAALASMAPARILPPPDSALIYGLATAGEQGRTAEAVLLAVIALGEAGPAGSHPLALDASLSALARVGLHEDARALAIEAALGRGL